MIKFSVTLTVTNWNVKKLLKFQYLNCIEWHENYFILDENIVLCVLTIFVKHIQRKATERKYIKLLKVFVARGYVILHFFFSCYSVLVTHVRRDKKNMLAIFALNCITEDTVPLTLRKIEPFTGSTLSPCPCHCLQRLWTPPS